MVILSHRISRSGYVRPTGSLRRTGSRSTIERNSFPLWCHEFRNKGRQINKPFFPRQQRQHPMRIIGVILPPSQGQDLFAFLHQQRMLSPLPSGTTVGQPQPLSLTLPPPGRSPIGEQQQSATVPMRYPLFFGFVNDPQHGFFLFRFQPSIPDRSHEPPFVFFRSIASSTACSANARSFSSSSRFNAS